MPLAIELAAARMDVFAPEQLSERLHRALVLLTSAEREKDPRHQSLEATLDWSYDLLAEPERRLFARLSVFAGAFSLEAAEAGGAANGIETTDVLKPFLSLVDKSLVIAEAAHDGGMRYRMLEPVRLYGHERLEESGEAEEVRRLHAEFFLSLAEEAEPHLRGSEQASWFERLDAENDNLRAALSWSLERGAGGRALRLSGALGDFWHVRGYLEEGRWWLEAVLASGDDAPATIKALLHAGWIAWEQLDYERSEAFGMEALALAREQGDRAATGSALYILGAPTLYQLDLDRAAALFEEAAQLQRSVGDVAGLARTMHALGLTAIARQNFELAAQLFDECLAISREAGDQLGIVVALGMGAFAFLGKGDLRRAGELFREGLELSRSMGTKHGIVFHLHAAAALASAQEQPVRSARLWGAGESLMNDIGTGLAPVERYHYGPYIASARSLLGEAGWDAAWAEGKAMTQEEAVEYALGQLEPFRFAVPEQETVQTGKEPTQRLTPREREVALLVGRGMTSGRIASELALSRRTVETHLRNILRKLGLSSSAQLAALMAKRRPLDDTG